MSALKDLKQVVAEHSHTVGATQKLPESWAFKQLDANSVRRAAILMLFGSADGRGLTQNADPADLDLLFVERAETLRSHAGQISFPGGGIDPEDASETDAALREAWEETGVQTSGIEVLGQLAATELPVSNFIVTPVLGWWHTESAVFPVDPGESAGVFRAPVAHLLDPRNRVLGVVQRGGRKFSAPAFEYEGRVIWGFTAMVADKLFNELGWTRPWSPKREIRML
ncbi:NUDIX domain-containing protein [Arthrobacter sp. AG1021]|uniref:NUDIX hydrolase n=1 Tax=Arthrobacter sp. AG1021 TaxID=2183908 RepID=UPI000EB1956B|nr:CoA pyrophosphatase [Arthrobacter sp. AG1021]RKS22143.1 NUDIX domain-containing protein [Arthrobacter sp. AG1021]